MILETEIDIETPQGLLERVPAIFEVETQTYPAEPFSWGQSRGSETETTAYLKEVHLESLRLEREAIAKWLGWAAMAELEAEYAGTES